MVAFGRLVCRQTRLDDPLEPSKASTGARRLTARSTPSLCAAALLVGGAAGMSRGAPPTCADVLKSIEKRMADAGVAHPPLKIVPKNLASGYHVVGTCEGGTQRIVHDVVPGVPAQGAGPKKVKPESASAKP